MIASTRAFFLVALALFLFIQGARAAGKQKLTDGELAQVTATGEPKENPAAVTSVEQTAASRVSMQPGSQSHMNAVALNNVAGSNLVANGINLGGGVHFSPNGK